VKVLSPEICLSLWAKSFSIRKPVSLHTIIGECGSGVPGSKSIAGHSTVHNGTWESHTVLERSLQQAEEARRRYGSVAVGPGHSKGVNGVMLIESRELGTLEGPGSKMQRDEQHMPYSEMENITLAKFPSYLKH
jgi:hypothetical protein